MGLRYVGVVNETLTHTNPTVLPERRVITLDEKRGITMAFRRIPADRFRMGQRGIYADEEPVHEVIIPHDFWMAETPVTQAQFELGKPGHENGFPGKPTHPAEQMTWHDAVAYCEWLTRVCRAQLPEGMEAKLPTEIEWEYACRARTRTEYHSGDGEDALKKVAWFDGNSGSSTHPVEQLDKNGFGLFDMHGNVWEWCEDVWDADAYKKRCDGHVAERSASAEPNQLRALRGGSWNYAAWYCRSAIRVRDHAGLRSGGIGFRPVLVPGPQVQDKKSEASDWSMRRRDDDEAQGEGGAPGLAGKIARAAAKLFFRK